MKKPEALEFVVDKILKDKNLQKELSDILKKELLKISNASLSASTFCSNLTTPKNLHKELLKRFGISDRQLLDSFEIIGFNPINKMYGDLYYQTLLVMYYIGIRIDDEIMRLYSLVLINVKVLSGRKYSMFHNGCQEPIAQYMITNLLRKSAIFVKYPNPFIAISHYFAPTIDTKYESYVKKDPYHPTKGLMIILTSSYNRIKQSFRDTLREPYYKVWNDSKNKLLDLNGSDKIGQEVDKIEVSRVETLVEKGLQNLVHKSNRFLPDDIKFFKNAPYKLNTKFLDKCQEFLNSDINEDDIKHTLELMLKTLKIQEENKLCGLHIVFSANKLSNTKTKNSNEDKIKKHIDELLKLMYPEFMTKISNSSLLRLRKSMVLMLLLRIKRAFCNQAKFED